MKKNILFILCLTFLPLCAFAQTDILRQNAAQNKEALSQLDSTLSQKKEGQTQSAAKIEDDFIFYTMRNRQNNSTAACSGVVLKDNWILTAAHCISQCIEIEQCEVSITFPKGRGTVIKSAKIDKDFFLYDKFLYAYDDDKVLNTATAQKYDIALIKMEGLKAQYTKWTDVPVVMPKAPYTLINRAGKAVKLYLPQPEVENNLLMFDVTKNPTGEGDSGTILFDGPEIIGVYTSSAVRSNSSRRYAAFAPIGPAVYKFINNTTANF